MRLGQGNKMADGPGDDVAVAVNKAFAALLQFSTRAMSRATEGFSATTATVPCVAI